MSKCFQCGNEGVSGQRHCRLCKNAYMRAWNDARRPPGKPKRRRERNGLCSKCGKPHPGAHAYCRTCQNTKARETRKSHSQLSIEQRVKANARAYLKEYVKRGRVAKLPCEICGNPKVEGHHEDHGKPLDVIWLCKAHHGMVTLKKLAIIPRAA